MWNYMIDQLCLHWFVYRGSHVARKGLWTIVKTRMNFRHSPRFKSWLKEKIKCWCISAYKCSDYVYQTNIHILEVLKLIYPLLLQNDTSLNDFISWCIRKLPRLFFSPDDFLDAKLLEFSLSTYVWKDNAAILLSVEK